MITFANAELLSQYLRCAETAHKASGASADSWSDWYAHYIDGRIHGGGHGAGVANANVRTFQTFLPGDTAPTDITS